MRRFPDATAYAQAFQNPQYILLDKDLASCACPKDKFGQPVSSCGSFAVTFLLKGLARKWAVRCFLADVQDRARRYSAISLKLNESAIRRSGYFVDFLYQDVGVLVKGEKFPIVKMDWAEGATLGKFLETNYKNGYSIRNLRNALAQLNGFLCASHIAHGDIQPENLMVSDDGRKVQLIDYDGMFVPGMENQGAVETGVANFQHPERQKLCPWNDRLDRFSFIVLDIALSVLEELPSYWVTTKSSEKKVLFDARDYGDPYNSRIFSELKNISKFSKQISVLQQICLSSFDEIPDLRNYIQFKPLSASSKLGNVKSFSGVHAKSVQGCGAGSNMAKFKSMFGAQQSGGSHSNVGRSTPGRHIPPNRTSPQPKKRPKIGSILAPRNSSWLGKYLPPGRSHGDAVGQLGAWLTRKGALLAYYVTYFAVIICVAVTLVVGVIKNFEEGIFSGILSIIWSLVVGAVSMPVSLAIGVLVAVAVWLLGKVCYNKWTLCGTILVIVGVVYFARGGNIEDVKEAVGNGLSVFRGTGNVGNDSPARTDVYTPSASPNHVHVPSSSAKSGSSHRSASQEWPRPKDWFYNECNVIERNIQYYTGGGYRYDKSLVRRIGSQISNLRKLLTNNDINESVRTYNELSHVYASFVNGCQWQANMRHPRYAHVISSNIPNRWMPEVGWEFVNPGTSDLTVRKKAVQVRCSACRGNGYIVQSTRCYSCNGRGRIPNPAAQVGQAVNFVGGIVNAIGGGRKARSLTRSPQGASEICCPVCNGAGSQQLNVMCNKCNGTGRVFR